MKKKKNSPLFIWFDDLKEDAQKRLIVDKLEKVLGLKPVTNSEKIKVIELEEGDADGYDENLNKARLVYHWTAKTSIGDFHLIWDVETHDFERVYSLTERKMIYESDLKITLH